MKVPAFLIAAALLSSQWAHAKPVTPAETVAKALQCELPIGKAAEVEKSLAKLGAKKNSTGDYVLTQPIKALGSDVRLVAVSAEEVEIYIAVFKNAKLEDVAAAAKLDNKSIGFVRDTKHGRLAADVRDRTDVWVTCTVTN